MSKECSKCNIVKSYDNFYKHKGYKDGYGSYCKLCYKAYHKKYNKENYERKQYIKKRWEANNQEYVKKWRKEYDKRYNKENAESINAYNARRRAERISAIPKSIREEDHKKIYELYLDVKSCQWLSESPLEVDHIIPLKHKNVCGLHVSWNLQVLSKEENNTKKNKFDGTYDNESWRIK